MVRSHRHSASARHRESRALRILNRAIGSAIKADRRIAAIESLENRLLLFAGALGPEVVVNAALTYHQSLPAIASDHAGDYVIAWEGGNNESGARAVWARLYDAAGQPRGDQFQVSSDNSAWRMSPKAAMDADGDFVVAWQAVGAATNDLEVFARRYSSQGVAAGDQFQVNTFDLGNQGHAGVGMDDAGNFTIVWHSGYVSDTSGEPDIIAQRFKADGGRVGDEFVVNTTSTAGRQCNPTIGMSGTGAFVVAWQTGGPAYYDPDVIAQLYDSNGQQMGGEFVVNSFTANAQDYPAAAMNDSGAFVIAWQSNWQCDTCGPAIYARAFNPGGEPLGEEALASRDGTYRYYPSVAMANNGEFVVTWEYPYGGATAQGVMAQQFAADMSYNGGLLQIAGTTAESQGAPAIAYSRQNFVVAWQQGSPVYTTSYPPADGLDIRARRFGPPANPIALGDFVWKDLDVDGVQDANEPGIAGVQVKLIAEGGDVVGVAKTDASGHYLLDGIWPGKYDLQFVAPTGYFFSPSGEGSDPAKDSDANPYTGKVVGLELAAGTRDMGLDAGLIPEAKISGIVFNDADGDGVRDAGEQGLSGWIVFLDTYENGKLEPIEIFTQTDISGTYSIGGLLPGTYKVVEVPESMWMAVSPAFGAQSVPLTVGQINSEVNFANHTGVGSWVADRFGPQVRVNTTTYNQQVAPAAARSRSGNSIVVWQSYGQDGNGTGIYGQLYDALGQSLGKEFLVNKTTASNQLAPAAAMDDAGNFVVVWNSVLQDGDGGGIYAQRFDSAGSRLGDEFRVNATAKYSQEYPAVAMDGDGDFVVTWMSWNQDTSGGGVYAQRFGKDGASVGPEFPVNTTTAGNQTMPSVAMSPGGSFVIAWTSYDYATSRSHVFVQRYDSAGARNGGETQVDFALDQAWNAAVAADASGNFAVASASNLGITARRFTAAGEPQGGDMLVGNTSSSDHPAIAMDDRGNFLIAWDGYADQWKVFSRRFNAAGVPQGTESVIASPTGTSAPALGMDGNGNYVLAWQADDGSNAGIFAQAYKTIGSAASVGNYVWNDADGDGIQDAGENGVDGVTVNLYDEWGLVRSAVTSGGGFYRFDGLPAGDSYQIEVVAPPGMLFTAQDQGIHDARDSDVNPGTGRTTIFTLNEGEIDLSKDAGLIPQARISGTVYWDSNGDGQRSAIDDRGLPAWTVFIDANANGQLDAGETSVVSAADGSYRFEGLRPGTYRIAEVSRSHWKQTAPAAGYYIVTLGVGASAGGYDFANTTTEPIVPARPLGPEFQVNTVSAGSQDSVNAAMNASGQFVMVWSGYNASQSYISAQIYSALGEPEGQELVVSRSTGYSYQRPVVAIGDDGSFVVSWSRWTAGIMYDVYARRFDATGQPIGDEFMANTTTARYQSSPVVALGGDGSFVIGWVSEEVVGNVHYIGAQRFDATGRKLGGEFKVNTSTDGNNGAANLAMSQFGAFAFVWTHYVSGSGQYLIQARLYDAQGLPRGGEVTLADSSAGYVDAPALAMDAAGGFVLAYQLTQGDRGADIYARQFDTQGRPVDAAFRVNTTIPPVQNAPVVAMDEAGDFVVAWCSTDQDLDKYGIYAQRYNAAGISEQGEFRVNTYTVGNQSYPTAAMDADGDFVVAWTSDAQDSEYTGIFAQRYQQVINPARVNGRVWDDIDADGLMDASEQGVDGVRVNLLTGGGMFLETAVTHAGGQYEFDYLRGRDSYRLEFIRPEFCRFSAQHQGGNDAIDSDVDPQDGRTQVFIPQSSSIQSFDAGLLGAATISGTVYNDLDGDGQRDPGEPGLSGFVVELLGVPLSNNAAALSNAAGRYEFYVGGTDARVTNIPHWTITQPVGGSYQLSSQTDRMPLDFGLHTDVPTFEIAPWGSEIRINTTIADVQSNPTIGADSAGNFAVAWQSFNQDGDRWGIYGQRLNADGALRGNEFRANDYTYDSQRNPTLAMNGSGNFLIAWDSMYQDCTCGAGVYARNYTGNGDSGPEWQVNNYTSGSQWHASAAINDKGKHVIAWESESQDGSGPGIYMRMSTGDGEIAVNSVTLGAESLPDVAIDAQGNVVVVWQRYEPDHTWNVVARRFDSTGAPLGPDYLVTSTTWGDQTRPAVAMRADGSFVVAWMSDQNGGGYDVYARRFDAAGNPAGYEFAVESADTMQSSPDVAIDAAGNFVIAWQGSVDGHRWTVEFSSYNAAGILEGRVHVDSAEEHDREPAVALDGGGGILVAWQGDDATGGTDIFARRFIRMGQVSGRVWVDGNGNGVQDANEPGLNGVGVKLVSAEGQPAGSTTTDSSGSYLFDRIMPGSYYVQVTKPDAYEFTRQDQGGDDALDSDVDAISGTTAPFNVGRGAVVDRDAGVYEKSSISGSVFNDADGDGVRDTGETGIAGWTVQLDTTTGTVTTQTDSQGNWIFQRLSPGSFTISEAQRPHWLQTAPAGKTFSISIKAGQSISGLEFGNRPIDLTFASVSGEFRVNTFTPESQFIGDVAVNPEGGYVVTWASNGQDGDAGGIYAQIYWSTGQPRGPEFRVNTTTVGSQFWPKVDMDSDGDFVIVWDSEQTGGHTIRGQRFDKSGLPLGGELAVGNLSGTSQYSPVVAMDADGDFVVTWTAYASGGDRQDIYAQRFASTGAPLGSTFRVNTYTKDQQSQPAMAMDRDGDFVVTWASYEQDGGKWGVYGQRFSGTGSPIGQEFRVNAFTADWQLRPSVAMDAAGGFVVVWESLHQLDSFDIFAQRYDATGMPIGGEFRVNTYSDSNQTFADVAMDADGDFVVTWQSTHWPTDSRYEIYAQRYNAAGIPQGGEFRINTYTDDNQHESFVGMNALGDTVIAWSSNGQDGSMEGVYARRYQMYSNLSLVRGVVFDDRDGDGVRDPGEPGIGNVPVAVMSGDGMTINSMSTAPDGTYRFDGLPAQHSYQIFFLARDGWMITMPGQDSQPDPITGYTPVFAPAPGQSEVVGSGGLVRGATIAGAMYNDLNGSGTPDTDEPTMEGWTIYIDSDKDGQVDAGEPAAVTGVDGQYRFDGLRPGIIYTVRQANVSGWHQTAPSAGYYNVTTMPGASAETFFANQANAGTTTASIGNFCWSDLNANGIQDTGETGIDGITVKLWSGEDLVATTTARNGYYRFDNVPAPGSYQLEFISPWDHMMFTLPNQGINDLLDSDVDRDTRRTPRFSVQPGQFDMTHDAGLLAQSHINGSVFTDFNGNASRDFGEYGLSGWTVYIDLNGNNSLDDGERTSLTDPGGNYHFDRLYPGTYTLRTVARDHYQPTSPVSARLVTINTAGMTINNIDLGQQATVSHSVVAGTSEIIVSSTPGFVQFAPQAAADAQGNYVVAWQVYRFEAGADIYARRYDAQGNPRADAFRVNGTTGVYHAAPAVAVDDDGDFVIAWTARGLDEVDEVVVRRYGRDGQSLGPEFQISTNTVGSAGGAAVAMDPAGNFVAVWVQFGASGADSGVRGQRYGAAGNAIGAQFVVTNATNYGSTGARIAMARGGQFVVAWTDGNRDGDQSGMFAQRFAADGTRVGANFQVNTTALGSQYMGDVAMDADGDFVIAWTDWPHDGSENGVFAQRFDKLGQRQGGEFRVNSWVLKTQAMPAVAMDADGDFAVVWYSDQQDGDDLGIFGQRYISDGFADGGEFQVNLHTQGRQWYPAVAMDGHGDFLVSWNDYGSDGSPICARLYQRAKPQPMTVPATDSDDIYWVRLDPTGTILRIEHEAGALPRAIYTADLSEVTSLIFQTLGGDDTIYIDLVNGNPIPSGGFVYDGGPGVNRIFIIDAPTPRQQGIQSAASPIAVAGNITLQAGNYQFVVADPAAAANVNVVAGAASNLDLMFIQRLASLTLRDGARVTLPVGTGALRTRGLEIDAGAVLDVGLSDLIVEADAATQQSLLNEISALIASARGTSGSWQGKGLGSSAAAGNSLMGLAAIMNDKGDGTPLHELFDGQAVGVNDILVKFTYNGDVNFDGIVNFDDYYQLNTGFLSNGALKGYGHGDLNYSGTIDFDDYYLINTAFIGQRPPSPLFASAKPIISSAAARTSVAARKPIAPRKTPHKAAKGHR